MGAGCGAAYIFLGAQGGQLPCVTPHNVDAHTVPDVNLARRVRFLGLVALAEALALAAALGSCSTTNPSVAHPPSRLRSSRKGVV